MITVGLVGCTGKLGTSIMETIYRSNQVELKYAIGRVDNPYVGKDIAYILKSNPIGLVVIDSILEAKECDLLIDCTQAEAFMNDNLAQYEALKKPLLIATTGFSVLDFEVIKEKATGFPVLFSANYSFALFKFIETLKFAAANVDGETDIQIIECHHNQKKDAPSGTALRIKAAILEANPQLIGEKISISSIRAGNILGEHRVLFANEVDEEVEFIHKVSSREAFASGIIKSAKWLVGKPVGYYTMEDLVKDC